MTKSVTAAELMAKLAADPEYVAMRKRRDDEFAKREADLKLAQAPMIEALHAVGVTVSSVYDLVNTAAPYPQALPVLLEHLRHPYPDVIREGIARGLGVPDARFAWSELVDLYRRESSARVKDGLAVALAGIANDDERLFEELVSLRKTR